MRMMNDSVTFQYQHTELRIDPDTDYGGKHYHKLFRDPADSIAVAEMENLENLKDLIDSEAKSTVNRLRELQQDIDRMQNLINAFGEGIGDILHHAPTYGLQGQCHIERELGVPAILRGRIMRFFRLRLLRNPLV